MSACKERQQLIVIDSFMLSRNRTVWFSIVKMLDLLVRSYVDGCLGNLKIHHLVLSQRPQNERLPEQIT